MASTSGFYAFVRPFDAADKTQDKLRIIADVSPTDSVDLGLEFNISRADYDETVLGRTGENAQAAMFDANFKLPYKAKLHTYVDYERREVDSHHVRWNAGTVVTVAGLLDILNNTTANNNFYQWFLDRQDITKSVGFNLELPVLSDRLLLSAGFDYLNNDGKANFSSSSPTLADIMSYDDYVKQTLKLKAEFAIRENLKLVTGYTYEKCEFEDVLTDGYDAQFGTTYLSGAYADMNYEANIGYVTLNYKF